jgi:deazaflavin-dependent oxidoreductase (nitroreductase family)
LLGIPYGEDVALIGSNWGGENTPGWVFNLEAHPQAVVRYRDRSVNAKARRADAQETEDVFARAASLYAGYASYRERASHRAIRVFVLQAEG